MKNQKVLSEEALKDLIRDSLAESILNGELNLNDIELNEDIDEGVFGALGGALISRIATPLIGKLCDALGIERDGVLGRVLLSPAVITAIGGTLGSVVGDKIGGNKFTDKVNNSKIGSSVNSFFGSGNSGKKELGGKETTLELPSAKD